MKSESTGQEGYITVVSGLPRSGTSMMMQILEAGGMPILADQHRAADEDNKEGYYELEAVKRLDKDARWVGSARGHAVKVISYLLPHLPAEFDYRIVFLERRLDEVLASQQQMLLRRGEPLKTDSDDEIRVVFERHLASVFQWMQSRPNIQYVAIDYNAVLSDPSPQIDRICRFLDVGLDARAMRQIVNPRLYRQRSSPDREPSEKG